jgi:hypothetical protein
VDVNNDDQIDIIVIDDNRNIMIVFLNSGNRHFIKHMEYSTGTERQFVIAADVNNDGYADIINEPGESMVGYGNEDKMSIHFNNGNGSFSARGDFYPTLCDSNFVTLADLNNGYRLDIIAVYPFNSKTIILLNTGNGTFFL